MIEPTNGTKQTNGKQERTEYKEQPEQHQRPAKRPDPFRIGMRAADVLESLFEKSITCTFMDGKAIAGVLVGVDQYDYIIRTDQGEHWLVHKSAVRYLRPRAPGKGE